MHQNGAWWGILPGEQGGILQASLNVIGFQVRVVLDDVLYPHPVGQQVEHQGRRYAHPPDTALPARDLRVKGDSVK